MVLPLLVVYELGLFVVGMDALNGADLVTKHIFGWLGNTGFMVANGVMLLAFVAGAFWLHRKQRFEWNYFGALLVETTAYGFTMGFVIIFLLGEIGLAGPDWGHNTLRNIVLSAGAGVFEELLFRVTLIAAIVWIWERFVPYRKRWAAQSVAVLITSLLFSLAHFSSSPLDGYRFAYLALAGVIFGVLYTTRGFAVAAYTHALYDIWVLEINPLLPW